MRQLLMITLISEEIEHLFWWNIFEHLFKISMHIHTYTLTPINSSRCDHDPLRLCFRRILPVPPVILRHQMLRIAFMVQNGGVDCGAIIILLVHHSFVGTDRLRTPGRDEGKEEGEKAAAA